MNILLVVGVIYLMYLFARAIKEDTKDELREELKDEILDEMRGERYVGHATDEPDKW